jgi:hypothetical protein
MVSLTKVIVLLNTIYAESLLKMDFVPTNIRLVNLDSLILLSMFNSLVSINDEKDSNIS